jgi:hypothetical protein
MKTTVELPEALLREARRVALRERTTLRAASFRGDGLVAGRSLRDGEASRDLTYSGRGA